MVFDGSNILDYENVDDLNDVGEAAKSDEGSVPVTKNSHDFRVDEESGICIQRYRQKVLAWFEGRHDRDLDFGTAMKGQRPKEVSRYLLAVLHLANEERLRIESPPLVMDRVLLRRLSE